MYRIGIISDTHGILNAKTLEVFQGVEAICHCGDIDSHGVLVELETIAPVFAIHGNVDPYELTVRYPKRQIISLKDKNILLTHKGMDGTEIRPSVIRFMDKQTVDIVCFGHTHRPYSGFHSGTYFINPGSATIPRHGGRPTVAILDLDSLPFNAQFIDL